MPGRGFFPSKRLRHASRGDKAHDLLNLRLTAQAVLLRGHLLLGGASNLVSKAQVAETTDAYFFFNSKIYLKTIGYFLMGKLDLAYQLFISLADPRSPFQRLPLNESYKGPNNARGETVRQQGLYDHKHI